MEGGLVDCLTMHRLISAVMRGVGWVWQAYRLYMAVILFITGPILMLLVLTMLVLWFGFGIRWGW